MAWLNSFPKNTIILICELIAGALRQDTPQYVWFSLLILCLSDLSPSLAPHLVALSSTSPSTEGGCAWKPGVATVIGACAFSMLLLFLLRLGNLPLLGAMSCSCCCSLRSPPNKRLSIAPGGLHLVFEQFIPTVTVLILCSSKLS